ncbi:MAG: cobalamin-dependent protein [Opitutaceae bacterium]
MNPRPIGAVVDELRRTYPDVSQSSLRFLEREGLIEPVRTPGGHRLYAADDVAQILRIKKWQRQRLSLDEIREHLARLRGLPEPVTLARRFLDLLIARDLSAARLLAFGADDAGLPLEAIFAEVIQPALYEVGVRWERGDLLVAQEKEMSEVVRDLIAELSARHAAAEMHGPGVVAACVEGERHELGLRMICGLLRAGGRPVHYLGADVAPRFLAEAVRLRQPAAVLLSAKLEPNLYAVKDALDALRPAPDALIPFPVLVGGHMAPEHPALLREWGAVPIVEERPAESVRVIESLLAAPRPAE